jgi:hypothetical protein
VASHLESLLETSEHGRQTSGKAHRNDRGLDPRKVRFVDLDDDVIRQTTHQSHGASTQETVTPLHPGIRFKTKRCGYQQTWYNGTLHDIIDRNAVRCVGCLFSLFDDSLCLALCV